MWLQGWRQEGVWLLFRNRSSWPLSRTVKKDPGRDRAKNGDSSPEGRGGQELGGFGKQRRIPTARSRMVKGVWKLKGSAQSQESQLRRGSFSRQESFLRWAGGKRSKEWDL
jgi:hypothetical protein